MIGLVTEPNIKGRTIVMHDNNLYIIKALGYYRGQEVAFNIDEAIPVESHMKALADIMEPLVKFVKENW